MRNIQDIINVALREHDIEGDLPTDVQAYTDDILQRINGPSQIPAYASSSKSLSLVSFQCLLQDTGYPMEVYLPAPPPEGGQPDMSQLAERWVGWATEIPGQQTWSRGEVAQTEVDGDVQTAKALSAAVKTKYPLHSIQPDYLGALVKVYDDVNFKPASIYTVTGILSTAALPTSLNGNEDDDEEHLVMVPTIHVLTLPTPIIFDPPSPTAPSASDESTRSSLIEYLSHSFSPPDPIGAEFLLLLLISAPLSRPIGQSPLGTLSLNLISPQSTSQSKLLIPIIESLSPVVATLPLSVTLLHNSSFNPRSSDSTTLESGILQLAPGTVLAIQEGEMGEGGQLNEKAINNIKALAETLTSQSVKYEYPYMDGLKMDASIRGLVFSEGKSLLPVDVHLPLLQSSNSEPQSTTNGITPPDLPTFRSYLSRHSSTAHASKVDIPEEIVQRIQDDFVASRQAAERLDVEAAEQRLKRRMRIARLLAQSHSDAKLSVGVWERAVELDEEAEDRTKRRQSRP